MRIELRIFARGRGDRIGAEISLLNKGFLPGDTIGERMELLADLQRLRTLIADVPARVNDFLRKAVAVVRERFGETYPDMSWEPKAAFAALADYYRG